jgi:hypothetical protein
MEDQTPQIIPQKRRKTTANYTAKGDLNVVNNYYRDDSPIEVVFDIWDLVGLAFLLLGILFLGGLAIWCLYEVGVKIYALWGWIAKNWRYIAVGFFAVTTLIGVTVWGVITYTKEQPDKDLL